MGLCGSSATGGDSIADKLKSAAFSLLVQSGGGAQNMDQFNILKSLISSNFPKAQLSQNIVPEGGNGLFNVLMDGKVVHSKEKDGLVQNNPGLLDNIKNVALQKLTSGF